MGLNSTYRSQLLKQKPSGQETYSQDKRLSHRLGTQSNQIERFLSQQRLPVTVKGGSVRRQWTEFDFGTQVGEAFSRISKMKHDLVAMLGVSDLRLGRRNGEFQMQVKQNASHPVDLLDLMTVQSGITKPVATLGLSDEGHQVAVDFDNSESSNILVAGVTGAGKSSLLRSMAVSMALTSRQSALQMVVIAPSEGGRSNASRRRVLFPMNYLPHLLFPVATSIGEAAEAIEYLAEEALFRAEEQLTHPVLIVLIDDIDKILAKADARLYESLAELLDAPKEAGLRIIMSATDVTSPELLRLVKFNVPLRLVGRMVDSDRAFLASGEPDTGAENLNGSGDFFAVSYESITRFQAAYIDDYDLHLTLTEMHRPRRTILLAQPLNPPESQEDDALRFTIDEKSGAAVLDNEVTQISRRPTEEAVEAIELSEVNQDEGHEDPDYAAAFEQEADERSDAEPTQSPLIIQKNDLSNNMVLNSPSWKPIEANEPLHNSRPRAAAPSVAGTEEDTKATHSSGSSGEDIEYDTYDDDWPLTGWDEEDNQRAKHLH
jgi:DNA segregation ATPase FtsK/SpoIIIE-like protein